MLELLEGVIRKPETREIGPILTIGGDRRWIRLRGLGWLLRNWKLINRLEVREHPTKTLNVPGLQWDAYLTAHGERVCGRTARRESLMFQIDFASIIYLTRFLDRRIFRDLPITWLGTPMRVGDATYKTLPRNY